MTTLFWRDDHFTDERVRDLRRITENERRARPAAEPGREERAGTPAARRTLGPALVVAFTSALHHR